MAENGPKITIEVACATPARQRIMSMSVPEGTTARDAVRLSGIADDFPDVAVARAALGIFGRPVEDSHVVEADDRVEIYRPLEADPRDRRRDQAARGEVISGAQTGSSS